MGNAMQQLHRMANGNVVFGPYHQHIQSISVTQYGTDYDWSALTSPIVDVGGGIGSLELALVKSRPQDQFQFVLFDIPKTIENAKKVRFLSDFPSFMSIS